MQGINLEITVYMVYLNFFYPPVIADNMRNGTMPPAKKRTIPAMVKGVFLSIIPLHMSITPINASIGGIMWEKSSEPYIFASAILSHTSSYLIYILFLNIRLNFI